MVRFFKSNSLQFVLLFEVLFLLVVFYSKFEVVSPDFKVFYLQSERLINGQNVFDYNEYVAYNSTLLYLLISPLTFFDLTVASVIFLSINLLLIPIVSFLLVSIFGRENFLSRYVLVVAILEISFYVRSILNNGQVGLIMLLFLLLAIKKLLQNQGTSWFAASMLWFAFELKPYLIIPLLIWIYLVTKNHRLAAQFVLTGTLFELVYFYLNPSTNLFTYINLLYDRLGGVSSELDQSSVTAVAHGIFELPKLASYFIHLVIVLAVLNRIMPYIKEVNTVSFALVLNFSSLANVYLHRQDPIITILVFLILCQKIRDLNYGKYDKLIFFLALVLLTNWGNLSFTLAVAFDVLLLIVFVLTNLSLRFSVIILVFSLLMQYAQVYVLLNYGWIASYELWRILILFFTLVCSLILPNYKIESQLIKKS